MVIADGDYHEVSCCLLEDGVSSPVTTLLDELNNGVWPEPNVTDFPDEYQANYRSRLLAEIEHLCALGVPARDYDYLTEGIWEFKIAGLRVTFFDTPGDGTYSPKVGERATASGPRRFHFPDEFDEFVRLGHYFGKDTGKTRQEDLRSAKKIRKEDLAHDCN